MKSGGTSVRTSHTKRLRFSGYSHVFLSLIFSFLGVMLIPIIAAVILGMHSLKIAGNEIQASNELAQDNILAEMEAALSDATNLSYRSANSATVRSYSNASIRQHFTEYQVCNQLKNDRAGFSSVQTSYLYLPQFKVVLAAEGGSSSEDFFKTHYGGVIEDWYATLEGSTMPTQTCFLTSLQKGQPDQFALIRCVSQNNPSELPAVIVTHLNTDFLSQKLNNFCRTELDKYVLYNNSGIILSNAGEYTGTLVNMADTPDSLTINDTEYLLIRGESNSYPINIIYAVSENFKNSPVRFASSYVLITLSFCIVSSILLCLLLARKNYRPVRKICSLLGSEVDAILTNEYGAIENALENYKSKNSLLAETLDRSVSEFHEMYLEKLLLGKVLNSSSIKASCDIYGIDFANPLYYTILFELSEDSILFRDDNLDEVQRQALTKLIIQNVATEIFSQYCIAFVLEVDDKFVCICNIKQNSEEAILKCLNELAQRTIEFIDENFFIKLQPYISTLYTGAEQLPTAFLEVQHLCADEQLKETCSISEKNHPDCIEKCIEIIKEQYADNNLSLSSIAGQLNLNSSYISRYFKQQTGIGLLDYLHRYRLSVGKSLIKSNPDMLMKDVAEQSGFYNISALTRVFKKLEGVTPSQFRNAYYDNSTEK